MEVIIHPSLVMVPDPRLREKSYPVLHFVKTELINLMREVLTACREHGLNTVSISAPQVGAPLRVFIIDGPALQLVAINPVITKLSGEQQSIEGCLSFPAGTRYKLKRANIVKFRYTDQNGFQHSMKFHDLYAAIVQHEIDHLDGILMDDNGLPFI